MAKKNNIKIEVEIPPERWEKKKEHLLELAHNIQKLRLNVTKCLSSDDEKEVLTALVVAIMGKTGERVGNDDSASNGHFGVTGFRKKHISVIGKTVHLDYVGKSGVKHEKSFSDERIAKALKKAIKNSKSKYIFETSDRFRIKADRVNRYLTDFNITAKDLRGFNANSWLIKKLQDKEIPEKDSQRKKLFNKLLKQVAERIGHGSATLKKHYLIPELPTEYIEKGKIIDMKNLNYETGNFESGGTVGETKEEETAEKEVAKSNIPQSLIDKIGNLSSAESGLSQAERNNNFELYSSIQRANDFNEIDDLISEYYHKAKKEGNNTEIVKEIEQTKGKSKEPKTEVKDEDKAKRIKIARARALAQKQKLELMELESESKSIDINNDLQIATQRAKDGSIRMPDEIYYVFEYIKSIPIRQSKIFGEKVPHIDKKVVEWDFGTLDRKMHEGYKGYKLLYEFRNGQKINNTMAMGGLVQTSKGMYNIVGQDGKTKEANLSFLEASELYDGYFEMGGGVPIVYEVRYLDNETREYKTHGIYDKIKDALKEKEILQNKKFKDVHIQYSLN